MTVHSLFTKWARTDLYTLSTYVVFSSLLITPKKCEKTISRTAKKNWRGNSGECNTPRSHVQWTNACSTKRDESMCAIIKISKWFVAGAVTAAECWCEDGSTALSIYVNEAHRLVCVCVRMKLLLQLQLKLHFRYRHEWNSASNWLTYVVLDTCGPRMYVSCLTRVWLWNIEQFHTLFSLFLSNTHTFSLFTYFICIVEGILF